MGSPTRLKEVQKLTRCVVALNRFISRMGEKGLPLFKLLKKSDHFMWTSEVDQLFLIHIFVEKILKADFQNLKRYISFPPVLTAPRPDEELLLYIADTPQVANAVLVIEREGL